MPMAWPIRSSLSYRHSLKIKGLEPMISKSVVHWFMDKDGWTFEAGDGVVPVGPVLSFD